MPKLKHFDNLNTARAISFSCYRRMRLLKHDEDIQIFLHILKMQCTKYNIDILGYVIMPSHVHLVLHPCDELELGRVIGKIKSLSAREILDRWRTANIKIPSDLAINNLGKEYYAFWQKRCYDHNCRTVDTVCEKINYCHMNPVKAGLVRDPGDWRWSSYNWYCGKSDIALEISGIEV